MGLTRFIDILRWNAMSSIPMVRSEGFPWSSSLGMGSRRHSLRYNGDVLTLLRGRAPGRGDQVTVQAGMHRPRLLVDAAEVVE